MVRLRLGEWHVLAWGVPCLWAMAMAVRACLRYNEVAGTDLSTGSIAGHALAMIAGPFAGPLTGGGDESFYRMLTPIPLLVLAASWLPFLLVKRPLSAPVRILAWSINVAGAWVWFASAILSLGYRMS